MATGDELGETATSGVTPPAAPRAADSFRAGDQLGRYVIERVLGAGGMGLVYAAHDPDLDRRVAIKVLRGDASEESRVRLLREARAMAKLSHPNVITVYEVGTAAGVDFVAMELLEGGSLADWLRAERRSVPEVLRRFRAAGAGLAAAHGRGLVHRDFKPANVLLGRDGQVVVTDFGLARGFDSDVVAATLPAPATPPAAPRPAVALDETLAAAPVSSPSRPRTGDLSSTLTRTGAVLGTPAYMAPEQFVGGNVGPAADQFAFAVAMWEGLTGARPFAGATLDELRSAVEAGAPSVAPLPRVVRPVLARALARDPAARWPSMAALLAALDRRARRPLRVVVGGAVAAALLGGLAVASTRGDRKAAPAAPACAIGADEVTAVWTPAVAARLAARFADVPAWPRLASRIDAFAAAWRRERDAACAAPTAPSHHGRVACLAGASAELEAALDLLDQAPPSTVATASPGELLTPPEACRSGRRAAMPPLSSDPAVRAAVAKLLTDLAEARMLARGGAPIAELRRRVDAAVAVARSLADRYPPALAMALETRGTVAQVAGDCITATKVFEEAATAAEASGADGIRAISLIGALECAIDNTSDLASLERPIEQARAAIQRAGDDPALTAALELMMASLDAPGGELDRAIERSTAARTAFVAAGDQRRAALAATTEASFRLLRSEPGDRAAAITRYREALAGYERSLGPGNAETEKARMRLGLNLIGEDPVAGRALIIEASAALPRTPLPADAPTLSGRVVDHAGRAVAGATVSAASDLLTGFDGIVVPLVNAPFGEGTTDADGRFQFRAPPEALVTATAPGLRAQVSEPARGALALRMAPAVAVTFPLHITPPPAPASDAPPIIALARRAHVYGVALARGASGRAMSFGRDLGADRWAYEGVAPGPAVLVAIGASRLGDRLMVMRPETIGAADAVAPLDVDLDGTVVDVIVRAERGHIPTAQVMVFPGRLAKLPTTADSLWAAAVTARRTVAGYAVPVADVNRTEIGAARYRPGDIHVRLGFQHPGPATACVMPFAGDIADAAYAQTLVGEENLEVRCTPVELTDAPVQVIEVRAPAMKNAP